MLTLELSAPVFSILSSFIEEKVGIHYELSDLDLLREKVSGRAIEAGFSSLLDYYYFLRYDPASDQELRELVESLVVNETYFFREWPSLKMLVNQFVVPHCRPDRKLRIWSAACASGEEPLSLAMMLDQMDLLNQVEIIASDISPRVLAKAQAGVFGKRSIRSNVAPELVEKYIQSVGEGYAVSPRIISSIDWRQQNLLSFEEYARHGSFDIILCRNVLIYFADNTIKKILENLSQSLVTNGVLLIGVSESLFRYGSAFSGEEHEGCFIYRKANN